MPADPSPADAPPPPPSLSTSPCRLVVLISGGGTTLINLHSRIRSGDLNAEIVGVLASRDCAGVEKARDRGLPTEVISARKSPNPETYGKAVFDRCRESGADLVVLAGFLSRITIPDDFHNRVMNIHPSLIPAFCGKGMYGHHVHEAVIQRGCKVSGCTVHFCDNDYDEGPIILQESVPVLDDDTPDTLASRVFELECRLYPEAIRLFQEGKLQVQGRRVRRFEG